MNKVPDFQRGLLGTFVYFSPLLKLSVGIKKNITASQMTHYTLCTYTLHTYVLNLLYVVPVKYIFLCSKV